MHMRGMQICKVSFSVQYGACLMQAEHASSAPTPKRSRTAQASAQSDTAAGEATDQQIEAQMRQVVAHPCTLKLTYLAII